MSDICSFGPLTLLSRKLFAGNAHDECGKDHLCALRKGRNSTNDRVQCAHCAMWCTKLPHILARNLSVKAVKSWRR